MDELDEVESTEEEALSDKELADLIRDTLEELNSLRAEIYERGYVTSMVGEDSITIYRDQREEI